MTLRSRAAVLAGAIYWFCFGGALVSGLLGVLNNNAYDLDASVSQFIGAFLMGGFITAVMVIPIAMFASLDADLTTKAHRARVRFLLLLPGFVVLPLLAWASCAAMDVPWAGSAWWLSPFALTILFVTQRNWDKMLTRATGDRCVGCGYLLIGLPQPRCPECGRAFYPGQTVK